jgi:hypothetical protein
MGFQPEGGILLLVQVMKSPMRTVICLLTAVLLAGGFPFRSEAKGYSSGGGHSYSSHSSSSGGSHSAGSGSSHNFSSGSGHSFSSGSSHVSSSGNSSGSHSASSAGSAGTSHGTSVSHGSSSESSSGGKNFSSGGGKSYSSGSTWSDNGRHSYTSSKSYSSGADHTFTSASGNDSGVRETQSARNAGPGSGGSGMTFDNAAAHARKEEVSKAKYTQFKEPQLPPTATRSEAPRSVSSAPSYRVQPPPIRGSGGSSYQRVVYVPDAVVLSSRPVRVYNVFNPYVSRPWVTYQDPYNSLFWWWLLDRSIDDRAWWAYHHRYDMDPARYQALVASDQQLESRVEQLEAQQAPRDPAYTPPGVDRDLMYSDHYVQQAYSNRPTTAGVFAFWLLAVPTALGVTGFFIWLIWFKRWQPATAVAA